MNTFKQVNFPVKAWQFNGELPSKEVLSKATENGYSIHLVYGRLHVSSLLGSKDTQVASPHDWLVTQVLHGRTVFWIESEQEFQSKFMKEREHHRPRAGGW